MKALNLEMKTLNGKMRRLCGGRAGGKRLGLESVGRRNMIIGRQFIGAMAKLAKEFEIKGGAVRVLEATTDAVQIKGRVGSKAAVCLRTTFNQQQKTCLMHKLT